MEKEKVCTIIFQLRTLNKKEVETIHPYIPQYQNTDV